jgi:LDH2 family malate/lactate/ureidoglycolate dehydrogenase
MVGTNPIAVAVPTGDGRAFVLDMATSTVALGRLEVHARKGLPLQPGWAIDAAGHPTLDAAAGLAGVLLPLGGTAETGGYKGYGLGVMIDLLTGVLSGARYGPLIGGLWDTTVPSDLGHFFLALNPAAFGPIEAFHERARDLRRRLTESGARTTTRACTACDSTTPSWPHSTNWVAASTSALCRRTTRHLDSPQRSADG